jgi:hypothetical protein
MNHNKEQYLFSIEALAALQTQKALKHPKSKHVNIALDLLDLLFYMDGFPDNHSLWRAMGNPIFDDGIISEMATRLFYFGDECAENILNGFEDLYKRKKPKKMLKFWQLYKANRARLHIQRLLAARLAKLKMEGKYEEI